MRIDRRGQEYARFPATGAPASAGTLEVSFDDGATWHPMTWNQAETAVTLLVSGPDMPNPAGVVLKVGRNQPLIRLTDTPEVVIRSTGGSIDVA